MPDREHRDLEPAPEPDEEPTEDWARRRDRPPLVDPTPDDPDWLR
jgi:hypothetical protein